jgi:RHS repeat-associated protein
VASAFNDNTVTINPGAVTRFAGDGTAGTVDGLGSAARFKDMGGAEVVGNYAYVTTAGAIRKVDLTGPNPGYVSTLAGSPSATGCVNSSDPANPTPAASAQFSSEPGQLDTDGTYLYVSDKGCSDMLRVAVATGATSVVTSTRSGPLTYGPDGMLYVIRPVDGNNLEVDKVSPTTGTSTTYATIGGLTLPFGVTWGNTGGVPYLWLTAAYSCPVGFLCTASLEKINLNTGAITEVGSSISGTSQLASAGDYLYTSFGGETGIERITKATGAVVRIAGTTTAGDVEGTGTDAWLSHVTGIASNGTNLWVADTGNHRLLKLAAGTVLPSSLSSNATTTLDIYPAKVSTFAGDGISRTQDGVGNLASFKDMGGAVVVGTYAYVATAGAIRKVDLTGPNPGTVSTLAGSADLTGCTPSASASAARFSATPGQMDSDGYYLYLNDAGCGTIDRISIATGATSLVITGLGGPLTYARNASGLGRLYVVQSPMTGNIIYEIDPVNGAKTQLVTTPGDVNAFGITADQDYLWITAAPYCPPSPCVIHLDRISLADPGSGATQFVGGASMTGVGQLVSAGDYIYTSSPGDTGVMRITKSNGAAVMIVGGSAGSSDDEWAHASFGAVTGVATDGSNVWVADSGSHKFRKILAVPRRGRELGPGSSMDAAAPRLMSGDPVDTTNGNYSESFTDASLPGIGLPFVFTRYYNSMTAAPWLGGDRFGGVGWTDSFDASVEIQGKSGDAVVYLPGGQIASFTKNGSFFQPKEGVFDTLTLALGVYTLSKLDGTMYHFDQNGKLQDITDRDGHVLALHYNVPGREGRLDYVIDTVGRQINFTYSTSCPTRISRITLPDNRYVEYTYGSACLLSYVYELDADGLNRKFTNYTWTGSQISGISHGMGTDIVMTYYPSGQVLTQTDATGTTTYTYTGVTTTVERNGHQWTYTYSPDGVLQSVQDPKGNVTTYLGWSLQDLVQEVDAPGGQQWLYTYDQNTGQVTSVIPPVISNNVTYTYNGTYKALIESVRDGRGNTTRFEYTGGDLTCTLLPGAATSCGQASQSQKITYTYDSLTHQLRTVTDPNGHLTTYNYFASTSNPQKKGLLQSVVSQMGLTTSYDYNASLQQASMVTPQGFSWTYTYDDAGRMLTATDPQGTNDTTTFHYDAEGNLDYRTDAVGHVVYYGHLPGGKLCFVSLGVAGTSCSTPPSASTSYSYDPDGNLYQVKDGNGHVTSYAYWENGQLKTVTDPLNRVWSYALRTYTANSSQLVETMSSNDTITTTFDAMSRPTKIAFSTPTAPGLDATPTQEYAYDEDGNLCYAATGPSSVTCASSGGMGFTYDPMNRMLTAGGFTYTYDFAGNLKTRQYPDGKQYAYTFDGDDRLCGVNFSLTPAANCSSGAINVDYSLLTANPAKITKNFSNGQQVIQLNKAGQLAKLTNKYGAGLATLSSFDPNRNAAGFPTTAAVVNNGLPTGLTTETQTYTYSATTARLTKICYDAGGACGSGTNITGVAYIYDGAGNLTSKTVTGGPNAGTTNYGYDNANELCWSGTAAFQQCGQTGGTSFTYTANGDRLSYGGTGGTQLRYDLAHRLTKATVGSSVSNYTYDVLGNRATDSNTGTTYTWDPNAPVAQLATASGGAVQDFFYGLGLEGMKIGSTNYFYSKDHTGSVVNVQKNNGTLEYSYSYQPYGGIRSNRKNDAAAATDFNLMTFDSEYRDTATTGFVNLRARVYDPAKADFLQADPASQFPSSTFADGNPAMFSDPSGLNPVGDLVSWLCGGSCGDFASNLFFHAVSSWEAGPDSFKAVGGAMMFAGGLAVGLSELAAISAGTVATVLATAAQGVAFGTVTGTGIYLGASVVFPQVSLSARGLTSAIMTGAIVGLFTGVAGGLVRTLGDSASSALAAAGLGVGGALGGAIATPVGALLCGQDLTLSQELLGIGFSAGGASLGTDVGSGSAFASIGRQAASTSVDLAGTVTGSC